MDENKTLVETKVTKCLNCGTEFQGNFCPNCGQKADTGRFTIKFIIHNFIQGILSNDGGVWFTIKNLFTRPGQMMVDIINGKRKSYFSPFPMLFLTLSLYVVIFSFTGSRAEDFAFDSLDEMYAESVVDNTDDDAAVLKHNVLKNIVLFSELYRNHYTSLMALTIPLYILAARVCYGRRNRRRYNWGEYCIPVVYATIIVFLYQCLTSLCFVFSKDLCNTMDNLSWVVTIVAYSLCFKKMLGFSVVKTVWRSILVAVAYFMIICICIGIYGTVFVLIHLDQLRAIAS